MRRENGVNFSDDYTKIAGDSIGNAGGNGQTVSGVVHNTSDYEYFLVKNKTIVDTFDNTEGLGASNGLHNRICLRMIRIIF